MTTSTESIFAGNTARVFAAFRPESGFGPVALADVTCRIVVPVDYAADITADVTQDSDNRFHVDIDVPEDAPEDEWVVMWESDLPSPVIKLRPCRFHVDANTYASVP